MQIHPVVDEGLGNSSYAVDLGDGSGMVIDAFRNPRPYLKIAEREGLTLRLAFDTHLHADFISGGREIQALGATFSLPQGSNPRFAAGVVEDGQQLDLGGLTLEVIATPGHTPEHLAYLLRDGAIPLALFSGGTLIPGGVARPDLLGPEHTDALARAAYQSIHTRLLTLPDDLAVYPTHGPGSFCSTGPGNQRVTTIGQERAANPLLQATDEDAFVQLLLQGLGSYPPYFLRLRDVNQAGPPIYGANDVVLPRLTPSQAVELVDSGAQLIDPRRIEDFAAGHIPGSLSIAWRPQFATWLGWLLDETQPIVLVDDPTVDLQEVVRACLSIGHDAILGVLDSGVAAWRDAGLPLAHMPLVPGDAPAAHSGRQIIDVRQQSEWDRRHIPGALHVELGSFPQLGSGQEAPILREPLLLQCGHGERAMTAASLLRQRNADVAVMVGWSPSPSA